MKKFKRICCLALVATTLFSVSAFAADSSFSFTLSPSSGAKYSTLATSWKTKQGNGTFDISYTSKPSRGTGLRLHGATVTSSGTSTIHGTWRP